MRPWWRRQKHWELRTHREHGTYQLFTRSPAGIELFLSDMHPLPSNAAKNIDIIERAMCLTDILSTRDLSPAEVSDRVAKLFPPKDEAQ